MRILPDYGDAWFNLGMGYKELEDYKKAIACFENAEAHMVKTNATFYVAAGIAYGEDGQYEKAIQELQKPLTSTVADMMHTIISGCTIQEQAIIQCLFKC